MFRPPLPSLVSCPPAPHSAQDSAEQTAHAQGLVKLNSHPCCQFLKEKKPISGLPRHPALRGALDKYLQLQLTQAQGRTIQSQSTKEAWGLITQTFPFTVGVPPVQIPHLGLGHNSSHASLSVWYGSCQSTPTPLGSHPHCPPTAWGAGGILPQHPPYSFFLVCGLIKALDGRTSWLIFWWSWQGSGLPGASTQNHHHA